MTQLHCGILAATLAMGITSGANAQTPFTTTKVDKPFLVSVGTRILTDGDTKDALGDNMQFIGLGYDFLKTTKDRPIVLSIFADYHLRQKKTITRNVGATETKVESFINLGFSARYLFVKPTETTQVVPYAGVGLGFVSFRVLTKITDSVSVSTDKQTKSGLGVRLFVGGHLEGGYVGEVEYNVLFAGPNNRYPSGPIKPSGIVARVGYRF